jgi:two-component system, NarL family, sensor kinase
MTAARDRLLARYVAPAILLAIAVIDILAIASFSGAEDLSPLKITFALTVTLVAPAVGVLIVRRHPRHPVGWLLIAHGAINAPMLVGDGLSTYLVNEGQHVWAAAVEAQISQAIWPNLYLCIMLVSYVFPTGHFLSRRWRNWVFVCLAGYAVFMVSATFGLERFEGELSELSGVEPPLGQLPQLLVGPGGVIGLALIAASLIGGVVCARARLRRAVGDERRQMLWFTWAALSVPAGIGLCWTDAAIPGDGDVMTLLGVTVVGSVLPLGIGAAILRSQLFDIEVVLSRTLTYGALTAVVVGMYAAVLAGVGALLDNRSFAGFIGVAVVAVALQPVHARLRRRVDRWVYGDRADPYAALRRLSDRLEASADPTQALTVVTTSIAEALRVDRVRVLLEGDAEPVVAGAVELPLVHRGTHLGELVVEVPRGRQLTVADRQLLDDLARHAAVIVSALKLTLDLQHSRARLVSAREEERRRLRRDLHDGVGPSLAAMVLKLNVLDATVDDPSSTELLREVREETKGAIAEIRRLVDDLRPPALDEVGLLGALRQKAVSLSAHGGDEPLVVEVDGPDRLPPLPAAAEVAAYRIAMEAITNVVRHARATRCVVRIAVDGALELTVEDNGAGLRGDAQPGVGLASMRERADELGGSCAVVRRPDGGTLVRAVIPLVSGAAVPEQPAAVEQPVDVVLP